MRLSTIILWYFELCRVMNHNTKANYNELLESLENAVEQLAKTDRSVHAVRGLYAEYFVVDKLQSLGYDPQIGDIRKIKNADIYLPSEGIRIEVKACGKYETLSGENQFEWSGGIKQIIANKFDILVLLGFKKRSTKIEKFFVINKEDFVNKDFMCSHYVWRNKKGKPTKVYFGICYGIEQEGHGKLTALERNLENNPRKYKSLKRAIENQ